MKYIIDIRDGDNISEVYLCKVKNIYESKVKKNYYSLTLQDKTGTLDAKVWDLNNAIEHFEAGDYIYVMGNVNTYRGKLQLSVLRLKRAVEGDYNVSDYMMVSPLPMNDMIKELDTYLSCIDDLHIKELVYKIRDNEKIFGQFTKHPAAKSVHHGFMSGLLHHTIRVMRLCKVYADTYPLNRSILLGAAFLHDLGKIYELSEMPCVEYTVSGQLLGHIAIGYEIICKMIDEIQGFPEKLAVELKHCILAHHGKLEYGSPKVPSTVEALALHLADLTDSRIQSMEEAMDLARDEVGLIGYNRLFETTLYKGR